MAGPSRPQSPNFSSCWTIRGITIRSIGVQRKLTYQKRTVMTIISFFSLAFNLNLNNAHTTNQIRQTSDTTNLKLRLDLTTSTVPTSSTMREAFGYSKSAKSIQGDKQIFYIVQESITTQLVRREIALWQFATPIHGRLGSAFVGLRLYKDVVNMTSCLEREVV